MLCYVMLWLWLFLTDNIGDVERYGCWSWWRLQLHSSTHQQTASSTSSPSVSNSVTVTMATRRVTSARYRPSPSAIWTRSGPRHLADIGRKKSLASLGIKIIGCSNTYVPYVIAGPLCAPLIPLLTRSFARYKFVTYLLTYIAPCWTSRYYTTQGRPSWGEWRTLRHWNFRGKLQ